MSDHYHDEPRDERRIVQDERVEALRREALRRLEKFEKKPRPRRPGWLMRRLFGL